MIGPPDAQSSAAVARSKGEENVEGCTYVPSAPMKQSKVNVDASSPAGIDALFLAIGTLGSLTSFGKVEQAPTWDPQQDC